MLEEITLVDGVRVISQFKITVNGTPYKKPHSVKAYRGGVEVKHCTKCSKWKQLKAFRTDRTKRDGLYIKCVSCERKYFNEYNNTAQGKQRFKRREQRKKEVTTAAASYTTFVLDYFDNRCVFTGELIISNELDHFIPLAWGTFGQEYGNLIPINAELNRRKRTKHIFKFIKELPKEQRYKFYYEVLPFLAAENDLTIQEYLILYNEAYENRKK